MSMLIPSLLLLRNIQNQLEELSKDIQNQLKELLKTDNEKLKENRNVKSTDFTETLGETLVDLKKENSKSEKENSYLRRKIDEIRAENDDLKDKLARSNRGGEGLAKQVAFSTEKILDLEEKLRIMGEVPKPEEYGHLTAENAKLKEINEIFKENNDRLARKLNNIIAIVNQK